MIRRRRWRGSISVGFAAISGAATPFPQRLIPAGGLRPKATRSMKSKNLMESLMIDIPGTNIAGHMSGSRETKMEMKTLRSEMT